jgi:aminopeptidase N
MRRSYLCVLPLAPLLLGAEAAPSDSGRLPDAVLPVAYDITVRPDARVLTFTGIETVAVDVRRATGTVVLNAADLDVTAATVDGRPARVATDAAAQRLTLTPAAALAPGRHAITFAWRGKINRTPAGLFAIDYQNEDGTPARMLATQFEAPDARRFAPTWDEPAFKATFTLSAVSPAGQTAFSNMPAASVTTQADGTRLTRFATTPKMSSYLLFLGMGDVERKTTRVGNVEIGIITRRGVVDQGDYALASAKRLLAYYDDYFGEPYPLPKLDMIAGPGSSQFFSAMENWGAIFYFEKDVLFDPRRTTESGRQRIFTVVAHEMAHQWFGDLVTMRWWDDLWLNEGFASWMEGKASAALNPAWQSGAAAVIESREGAMALDATRATHPIVRRVRTVDEVSESFDAISYLKGQSVIGMLETTLGPDRFRAGIRRYMARYKYGNTVTDQLWAELAAASGQPVADIMHGFTLQSGVPLVQVGGATCANGTTTVHVAQGRFGLDAPSQAPLAWRVPLRLSTLGPGVVSGTVSGAAPRPMRVPGCGPVVANLGKGSYARIQYDDAGHAALVGAYDRMALADRLGLIADDFALAAGGYQDLGRWAAVADRVGADASPLEWTALSAEFRRLRDYYAGTPLAEPLRQRMVARLGPVLERLGYEARDGESPLATNLREELLGQLGAAGAPELAARARRYVAAMRTDPTAIPPAIRQPMLATYAANATPAEWDALVALVRAERNAVARTQLVPLLGASADAGNRRRAYALLDADWLDQNEKATLLRRLSDRDPDGAFAWATAHRAQAESYVETSSRAGFIVGLASDSNDPAAPARITAWANANLAPGSRGQAMRTVGLMAARRAVADRLRPAVARWLTRSG